MGREVDVRENGSSKDLLLGLLETDHRTWYTELLNAVLRLRRQVEVANDQQEKHVSEDVAVEDELLVQILHVRR